MVELAATLFVVIVAIAVLCAAGFFIACLGAMLDEGLRLPSLSPQEEHSLYLWRQEQQANAAMERDVLMDRFHRYMFENCPKWWVNTRRRLGVP